MSHDGRFHQTLELPTLRSCREGNGESAFAAIVEENIREMGIRGIIVNCNGGIINVFRKQIGTLHAELKRAKKKSEGFGVNRLTDKWRDQTYDVKLFYHELDDYLIEK